MHTNIPLWPNFSSLFQFTSAFTYWLLMPYKPLEYITKIYHIKMGRLRQNLVREWKKSSVRIPFVRMHIKLCYKSRKDI